MKVKLCGHPGCNKLVIEPHRYYCPVHQMLHDKQRKESAFKGATRYANYNTPEWKALRTKIIKQRGKCELCGSTYRLQVHHIIPARVRPDLFLNENNLQVLCQTCHNTQTQNEIQSRKGRDR